MYFSAFFCTHSFNWDPIQCFKPYCPKAHNLLQVNDYTFYSVMYMLSVLQGKAI